MKPRSSLLLLFVPLLTLAIAGCGSKETPDDGRDAGHFGIRDRTYTLNALGAPSAKIGPDGALTIGGKTLELTPRQRELAQAYHAEVGGIANDGIDIGKQGLALAGRALKESLQGLLSGRPETIAPNLEAEGQRIKSEALGICERLVRLRSAQDALAAAVPEFAPYAQLGEKEIELCRSGATREGSWPRLPAPDEPGAGDEVPPALPDDSTRA